MTEVLNRSAARFTNEMTMPEMLAAIHEHHGIAGDPTQAAIGGIEFAIMARRGLGERLSPKGQQRALKTLRAIGERVVHSTTHDS
jgi:hypothetical protein